MLKSLGKVIMMHGAYMCICHLYTLTLTTFAVAGKFVREYIDATVPEMAFGEVGFWLSRVSDEWPRRGPR